MIIATSRTAGKKEPDLQEEITKFEHAYASDNDKYECMIQVRCQEPETKLWNGL
uniref:Uncharacterized protein n=1 Tax=Arundo donax TaxID=35708 RepID=A0A0A9ERW7_ARUDO